MSQNNEEDDLSECLSKLFECPDENQTKITVHSPQTNVRERWSSSASSNSMLPTSKYLQQFNKSNDNDKQSWRSTSQDRKGRSTGSDRASSRVSGNWRSKNKGHATNSTVNRNRQKGTRTWNRNTRKVNNGKTDKELAILLQLSYLEPEEISLTLSMEKIAFLDALDNDVSLNHLVPILQIMNKLWSSISDEHKMKIITQSFDKNILDNIKSHLIKLPIHDSKDKEANVHFWKEPETFWNNLYNLYDAIFTLMPNTACELLPKMIKISLIAMEGILQHHEIDMSSNIVERFEDFQQRLTVFEDAEATRKKTAELEPPNDFQSINPYPSITEITTRDLPFIRPIITKGAYESVHHYLDVQYRLLREDFVSSLRNGICTYLEKPNMFNFEKQYDVRIYEKVRFIQPQIVRNGIAQLVQFSSKRNRTLGPEDSKHFIYGSLVCFSSDHFNSVIFGTVVDNDIRFLRNGQIIVDVKGTILHNCNYTMVECNVFFEPYYHVLQSLKKIDENNFPFQKYIVDVSSDAVHPKYITNLTKGVYKNRSFSILSPETWPTDKEMGLNMSQYKAFRSALTREFCIIQGPPGTGKTYTSLKIAEFLLSNKENLNYSGPILVVCFTNHALDQFLEGLLPFTQRILRVGGRSKNENLKEYNLKQYKHILQLECREDRVVFHTEMQRERYEEIRKEKAEKYSYLDTYIYRQILEDLQDKYKDIQESVEPINESMSLINNISANDGIINFIYFRSIDNNIHHSWFSQATKSDIVDWLMGGEITPNAQEQQEENVNTEDYNLYLNAEQINRERLVVDDKVEDEFSIFGFDSSSRYYLISLNMYREVKKTHQERINKICVERELLHLRREIRTVELKEKYLKWRLRQFRIGDIVAKPENEDYERELLHLRREIRTMESKEIYLKWRLKQFRIGDTVAKPENEDYERELLHLRRAIRTVESKENYLKWRLGQFRIGETIVKPENVDYNNPKLLTSDERWALYRYWITMLHQKLCDDVPHKVDHRAYNAYQQAEDYATQHIMARMDVIGMTTTGAAKNYDILQQLKCPIVIVEEAAEVLEAHVVTALSTRCQHLILIGDHKQLRPNTAQYNLAKKYNLEISLFERMVHNGIQCQQLEVQHRMRSEISRLITPAIYSILYDGDNVYTYPPIRGVTKSLYFITHTKYEDATYDSSSHRNVHEAIYLLELARYLIKQGYSSDDITILTTYSAQKFYLWKETNEKYHDLNKVNITVVDNFQGEENKIILLSLVRSNPEANIGFLKTENRVCVALSRAKEGLYIIGNMNNLETSSTIWPKIKETLVEQDSIGCSLKLKCQNHETITEIKTYDDFKNVRDGGCNLPCDTDLQCGHKCNLYCHPYDIDHKEYYCRETCEQVICARNHVCPLLCAQDCAPCQIPVEMELPCSHKSDVPCSTDLTKYKCLTVINATLPCGHSMDIQCYEQPEKVKCTNICNQVLKCGHNCANVCHIGDDEDHLQYVCKEPCMRIKKDCSIQEHKCDLPCHEPCSPCVELIQKRRTTCTHTVRVQCNANADDNICRENCRKMLPCGHHCPMKCFEPCGNCPVQIVKTITICGHSLKVKCCEEPDRQLCKEQCPLQLKCGHICKNKCNEPCTENCTEIITYTDLITGDEVTSACYLKTIDEFNVNE